MLKKISCLLILSCLAFTIQATDSEKLSRADNLFEAARYDEAVEVYESLYATGYFNEHMLYQMAFAYEQIEDVPRSIYYLRKAQWEYGNTLTDAKVAQLVQEMGTSRGIVSSEWSTYHAFIHRSYLLWLLLLTAVLGVAAFLIWRNRNARYLIGGITLASMGMFIAFMLIEHSFIAPDRGVIIDDTSFYDLPAYTSNSKEIPVSPGTLIHIRSKHDIWYHVSIGHYECWVPEFVVMKL